MVSKITCETRLADANFAHHRDEPATTDSAVVETLHQLRPLAVASDDRRTDDLGHRISIAQPRKRRSLGAQLRAPQSSRASGVRDASMPVTPVARRILHQGAAPIEQCSIELAVDGGRSRTPHTDVASPAR